jgi:hypothetical protein
VHSSRGFGRPSGGPEYPQAGAQIDYYLSSSPTDPITLEILDEHGTLIRAFSSAATNANAEIPAEPGMGGVELERLGTERLSNEPGMHRFNWDMRHAGPWDAIARNAGRRGPMVAPGMYQARLSVGGGFNRTVEFDLLIDPRVAADGVAQEDLEAQTDLNIKIRDFTSEAKMVLHRIEALLEQARSGEAAAAEGKLMGLRAKFVTAEGRYQTPMLIQQIGYLNGMTNRADQRPGNDAYVRLSQLRERLAGYAAELQAIVANDPSELNR